MKRDYNKDMDELASVETGLERLLRYNRAMWIKVDEKNIDLTLATRYFRSEEDSEEEIQLEKQIGAAAVCSCYDNPKILQSHKAKTSIKMQRQFIETFRAAKVEYMYLSGKFGNPIRAEQEKSRRLKQIKIARKAQRWDKFYKIIKRNTTRMGVKAAIATAINTVSHSSVTAFIGTKVVDTAMKFIPDDVKESMKRAAKEVCEKTVNSIDNNIERFKETKFGKKVTSVINEKVKPYVAKGVEIAAKVGNTIKEKISHGWTALKSFFA